MIAAALSALLLAAGGADALGEARAAMARGAFAEAWRLAGDAPEGERARVRAEILYTAGDPAGALAHAREGLSRRADDLDLLFYAAGAALWLQEGPAAVAAAERLERALEGASLPEEERAQWAAVAADYAAQASALQERSASLQGALGRSRFLGLGGLALVLALIAVLARGQPRGRETA